MTKKVLLPFILLSSFSLFAWNNAFGKNYAEYTLENALELFVLEDFSKAPVTIEVSVRAGTSAQGKENSGFFNLYSRLFNYDEEGNEAVKDLLVECNADSARYRTSVSPLLFEKTSKTLSNLLSNPVFSESALEKEFSKMKEETEAYGKSPAYFINTAIDSRVFSKKPWKNESTINPKDFSNKKNDEARTILNSISKNWYIPRNTSIFVSGPVKKEEVLELYKTLYSKVHNPSTYLYPEPGEAGGKNHKFVLVSPDFSTDMTQIVVQYTSLQMTEADIAAMTLNYDDSSAKKLLLRQRNLAIREAAYINFEAAHKSGCSRLVVQSLLEKPVNPKVNLAEQAELFISKTKEGISITEESEFEKGKDELSKGFQKITANSETFMDYLSQFRAIEDFSNENGKEKSVQERLFERPRLIQEKSGGSIKESLASEEPFVFVLLNSKTYQAQKKAFDKYGYLMVTEKNAAWYNMDDAASGNSDSDSDSEEVSEEADGSLSDDEEKTDFIAESRASIKRISLQNGIPVTVKTTQTTGNILIMVSLSLGKFSFEEKPGFEEVITRAFATNIQKEISKYSHEGILESTPEILSETFNSWSAITTECAKEDAGIVLKCIADALIFEEILPSEADSYVFSVQTQKRLYNANPVNQMTYRGIRWLYDQKIIRSVFSTDDDVLTNTTYKEILEAYPALLDSRLYNIVVVGNIDYDYLLEPLKKTFGLFAPHKTELNFWSPQEIEYPKDKAVSVKIRHLFFTDVKAEDAGPMPAILVPTKNFLDPVQFWLPSPSESFGKDESYFNIEEIIYDALLIRLKERLEEEGKNTFEKTKEEPFASVKLFPRTQELPCAALSFLSVSHTKKVEEIFSDVQADFISSLSEENENLDEEIALIKNAWLLKTLSGTQDNRGTAILIRKGGKNPRKYLDEYEALINAPSSEFLKVAKKYLTAKPPLRLYSSESTR